jgi:hypothetical protein
MSECRPRRSAGSANGHRTRKRGGRRRGAGLAGKATSATGALHRMTSRGGIKTKGTEGASAVDGTAAAAREEATERTSSATPRPSQITTSTTRAKSPDRAKTAISRSVQTIVATVTVKAKVVEEEEMIVEGTEAAAEAAATEASSAAVTTTRKPRRSRNKLELI